MVSLTSAYEKVHGVSSSPVSLRGVTPNHSMRDVRSESNPSQFELLRSSSPSTYKKISATASSPGADRQLSSARSAPSSMIALPQSSPSSSTAPNSLASKSVGSSPEPSSSAKPATPFVPRSPAPRSSDTEGSTPSRSDTGTTRTSETNASLVKAGSLFGTLSKTHSPSSLAFSFSVASVSNSDRGSDVPLRRPPSPSPAISSSEMGSSQSSRTLPKDSFGDIGFTSVSPLSISSVPSTMTFTPLDDDGKGTVPMMMFSTFDSRDSSTSALSRESDSYSVGHRYGGTQNGGELAGASGLKSVGLEGRVSEVNAAGGGRGIVDSEKDVVRIDREREERERAARKEAEEAAKALAAEEERRRVLLEETKKKEEEAKRKAEEEEVKRKAEEEKKRIADETAKKNEEAERRRKEKEALEKAEMEKAQKLEEEERAKKAAAEIEERRKAEEVKRREEEERAKEALRKETEEREKALAREAEMRKAEEEERRIAEDRLKPKGSSADVPSTPLTISVSAPSLPSPLTPPYSDFIFTKWLAERITGVSLWESAGESFVSRESRKREREGERER